MGVSVVRMRDIPREDGLKLHNMDLDKLYSSPNTPNDQVESKTGGTC
jgi:hypothetical protein